MSRKTAHQRLAAGLTKVTRSLGVPISFLAVGASESYSTSTGAVTLTGGETVTIEATCSEVGERSVQQSLAQAGDLRAIVEARLLRRLNGSSFEPVRSGRVSAFGREYGIVEISATRDGDNAPIFFELLLRV